MSSRGMVLLLTTGAYPRAEGTVPGIGAIAISSYYLFPEWTAVRHRINCFAEGIGVLLGGMIVAIGVHGLCTLPDRKSN